jgi:hypothetical protein
MMVYNKRGGVERTVVQRVERTGVQISWEFSVGQRVYRHYEAHMAGLCCYWYGVCVQVWLFRTRKQILHWAEANEVVMSIVIF